MQRRSFLKRAATALAALPVVGPFLAPEEEGSRQLKVRGTDHRGREKVEAVNLPPQVARFEAAEELEAGEMVWVDEDGRVTSSTNPDRELGTVVRHPDPEDQRQVEVRLE